MTESEAKKEIEHNVFCNTDNFEMTISKECYKTIIKALEKQIPKNTTTNIDDVFIQKKCSVCGNIIMPFDSKYCCDCGQRLE